MAKLFDYQKICQDILKGLPPRTKEVISRRFGLNNNPPETLASIGKSYGITRERVRQIEKIGLSKVRDNLKQYSQVIRYFRNSFRKWGNLRREDILLSQLGGEARHQVYFLLTLAEPFERFPGSQELWPAWLIDKDSFNLAQQVIDSFYNKFSQMNKCLAPPELFEIYQSELANSLPRSLTPQAVTSYLELSKKIQQNQEGLYGLRNWPEINPRGIKDKAYLVLKREKGPLHFREIANAIGAVSPQTVHNELIKDDRFVLVGRGLYALGEWGYQPGKVIDVIYQILKKANKPLRKEDIVKEVLKQRIVKKSTILLNLNNRDYFVKNSEGKYTLVKKDRNVNS